MFCYRSLLRMIPPDDSQRSPHRDGIWKPASALFR